MIAFAENEHSVDILQLGGCSDVLPLKRILGEQLANRVNAGHAQAHIIGRYRNLLIAEFSVHGHATRRERRWPRVNCVRSRGSACSVCGTEARSLPARADYAFRDLSLPVVAGSQETIDRLNEYLYIYDTNWNPVIILGGGKVGRAAASVAQATLDSRAHGRAESGAGREDRRSAGPAHHR
jgi:voltage-gated potassium channel